MKLRAWLRAFFVRARRPPARDERRVIAQRQRAIAARMRALGLEVDLVRRGEGRWDER